LEERVSQQERRIAALEAKQSQLPQMKTDLARLTCEVQTPLPQPRAFSETARTQISVEVEQSALTRRAAA
jgi:DNA recombination-dependent growth factor C